MKVRFLLPLCALLSVAVHAQDSQIGLASVPTDQVSEIRQRQEVLAQLQDVGLQGFDTGKRAATRMVGVPRELREKVIADAEDLEALLLRLYTYYGFTGTESLRFEFASQVIHTMRYSFRQYIAGIPTSEVLYIHVALETRHLDRLEGALVIDTGLDRSPNSEASEAIAWTLECIDQMDQWGNSLDNYAVGGDHEATLYYRPWGEDRVMTPWWSVGIEWEKLRSRHDLFWVDPNGGVLPQITVTHRTWDRCER